MSLNNYKHWPDSSELVCDTCRLNAAQIEIRDRIIAVEHAFLLGRDADGELIPERAIGAATLADELAPYRRRARYCLECFQRDRMERMCVSPRDLPVG
ncbi:MAG TPA: hypothetical protein VEA69_19090 [Tepidisphaeraceae bacterium]|nr:hypothetical protein [Tepidisphaeraceae bacterium]